MSKFKVDLSNCEREPIHVPGAVQSWGFLVVIHVTTNIIHYVSSNILEYLNITAGSLLGQPLLVLENKLSAEIKNPLAAFVETAKRKTDPEAYPINFGDKEFDLLIHVNGSNVVLEFESKAAHQNQDIHQQIGRHVSTVLSASQLPEILNRSAAVIRELINYDRVMIYQFMEDAHGKVVAESKIPELSPYLGLHYPASDIPSQARQLYKINKVRIIADVHSSNSSILSVSDTPLDLTHSVLRAVSPVHIQYLKNMGVASSFSVTLLCKGELWGLIACHNYTPKFINHRQREGARLLGQIISSSIEFKEEEIINTEQLQYKARFEKIITQLRTTDDIKEAVLSSSGSFKNIVKAGGAYIRFEGSVIKDGVTPSDEQIEKIIDWLSVHKETPFFSTNNLAEHLPEAAEYAHLASGLLSCTISQELKEYILWFRPEYVESISWAGNPDKPVEYNEVGELSISPRKSFDTYKQIIKGKSESWRIFEQNLALRFKEELLYIINKKASEIRILNEKLKEAYEELETFSSTISHDLKTPLTVIKSYAQLLERNSTLDDNGKNFAARISVAIGKMNMLIGEVLEYSRVGRSEIDFHPVDMTSLISTIKNELSIALTVPNLELHIGSTPNIPGDRTMLYQVFLNLMNNAIKYSRLSTPPVVKITGTEDQYDILYKIEDNGIGIDPKHYSKVFELFKRVNVSQDFEGTGVGLAIVKRIVEKHKASIWIESQPGQGTIFWLKFRKAEPTNG